tara:strand:- start:1549 stop:1812 length:264 start_codon:yes stop_codon:yes gene_type:complete
MSKPIKAIEVASGLIKSVLTTGAAADTNIAVAGIKKGDHLIIVLESHTTSAILTDRTAQASVTSDGNIQISVSTATDKILVFWQPLR